MDKKQVTISIDVHNNNMVVKCSVNAKAYWKEEKIINDQISIDMTEMISMWVLNAVKPVFFQMPFDKVDIVFPHEIKEKYVHVVTNLNSFLQLTNSKIQKYANLKNSAKSHDNVLFFSVGHEERAMNLYNKMKECEPDKIRYKNFDPGFNGVKRVWEDSDVPMSVDEFVEYIQTEKIRKIVSINMYILEKYLTKTGVYMIALFEMLGVEYIIMDMDEYDMTPSGYLKKNFLNHTSFFRSSHIAWGQRYWDKRYGMDNVHYSSMPQRFDESQTPQLLNDDYGIMVLTHCRLNTVQPRLNPIIFLLDRISPDDFFVEVQSWFASMHYMILHIMHLTELERLYYNGSMVNFFYQVTNFLKYEVIHQIQSQREIKIFGDVGWKTIFPEYYQEQYLAVEEKHKLIQERNHLFLLLNWSHFTTTPCGPFYDVVNSNIPFLNYSSLVKAKGLSGFNHFEYNSFEALNHKIDCVNDIYQNKELLDTIKYYKRVINDEQTAIADKILYDSDIDSYQGEYGQLCKEENQIEKEICLNYINHNEIMLREIFDVLFMGKQIQYDLESSKYFNRPYVQRIVQSTA